MSRPWVEPLPDSGADPDLARRFGAADGEGADGNARRTDAVEPAALGEPQAIADTFHEARLIPRRIDATDVWIRQPPAGWG